LYLFWYVNYQVVNAR